MFLAALIAGNITVSALKTVLTCSMLAIVGTIVCQEGWKVRPLVDRILQWPVPRDVHEVHMLLRLTGGAHCWIKNYAQIAWPLTPLLSCSPAGFKITPEVEEAVAELKQCLTSPCTGGLCESYVHSSHSLCY